MRRGDNMGGLTPLIFMVVKMEEYIKSENATVGTDNYVIAEETYGDAKRMEIIITNTSTGGQNLTLAFGNEAVNKKGIYLVPYGCYYMSATLPNGFPVSQSRVCVISDAAGGICSIFIRYVRV